MLSILIPVYNFDIRKLVRQLHQQGLLLDIPFEIICIDDASLKEYTELNTSVKNLEHTSFEVLEKNIGRSKIRNYLATKSKFNWLLFMDCDSLPVNSNYLHNYSKHLNLDRVVYGGRVYKNNAPKDKRMLLHWHYGKQREENNASKRNIRAYRSFMTNNFLITKKTFFDIQFNEELNEYGHEDTFFGLELKKKNISILHLDNPLEHIGLENNSVFIKKSEQAIQNLYLLYQNYGLKKDVKLLNYFITVNKYYFDKLILLLYKITKKQILSNLNSNKPKLKFFDFYKLGYMLELSKKNNPEKEKK
ncbi:MAG: glycosyltransferase family 2 protein [Saprospiraceae bacterium]|nr:glycosyltransferase family 2 protein [Saprospiraceae bacterium]